MTAASPRRPMSCSLAIEHAEDPPNPTGQEGQWSDCSTVRRGRVVGRSLSWSGKRDPWHPRGMEGQPSWA
jgi:hypothetical protein